MLYAVLCLDKEGTSDLRAATRPAHLEYLEKFRPRIAISGPLLKDDQATAKGSLLILEFADYAGSRKEQRVLNQKHYRSRVLPKTVGCALLPRLPQPPGVYCEER